MYGNDKKILTNARRGNMIKKAGEKSGKVEPIRTDREGRGVTKEELRQKANDLPLLPGVYLMMDRGGTVIYVGKAKKLRNRVGQYFQDSAGHTEKTRRMVSQIDRFDTILVGSEFEALVLENSLIKRHMPRYNILLKDDKGYPFVRLSREAYPRFSLAPKYARDAARCFGPFGSRGETKAALDAVLSALRLPDCRRKFPQEIGAARPCLNFHMGRCDGFCRLGMGTARKPERGTNPEEKAQLEEAQRREYNRRIEQAVRLLEGKSGQLLKELTEEMEDAAEALEFERAAAIRDRIKAIKLLSKKQAVIAGLCADTDIWGLYLGEGKSGYAVLHIEEGNLTGRETALFQSQIEDTESGALSALVSQYYLSRAVLPREILLPAEIEGCQILSEALADRAGHKVWVHVPQRGEKADLCAMARRNALEEVQRETSEAERSAYTLELLARLLSLPGPPERIEAYDISNTGKSDIVASMVVYRGMKPLKSAYRRFHIKELENSPDDYASMREVLRRRLERAAAGDEKFLPLPDLFLIDGGQTHAQAALEIAERFGVDVPIFGMVKDDRHRTRALITPDGEEIGISVNPSVFALVGRIQEETHRFAITFHRESHRKSATRSQLDGIPGIGPKRREALRKQFGTIKAIREADIETLSAVLPKDAAESVWKWFHRTEKG